MGSYLVIIAVLIIFFLHQEKKANSSGCVADTKSMYRIFIVEDDEIIARTVKSHLETMSDELRKSTIFH